MLDLREISDRLELQQLLTDYATAIDRRDWDALDRVFTPDASIDYTALGGIAGPYPQIKTWLAAMLTQFPAYYHLVANVSLVIDGDTATGRAICFNPVVLAEPAGARRTMFFGLWYEDGYTRTDDGWRICARVEAPCFDHNLPATMPSADEGDGPLPG